jgi:C2H2-type zinc finger
MARARNDASTQQEFKCPECGRTFSRAAALGAHRRSHGVTGASARPRSANGGRRTSTSSDAARSTRRRAAKRNPGQARAESAERGRTEGAAIDRDALLKTLFPSGIPATEEVIRGVNQWLDDAERLSRLR